MVKKKTDNDKKETGKCKNAQARIGHATKQVKHLTCQMNIAYKTLENIVGDVCENDREMSEDTLLKDCQRIVFRPKYLSIEFYIEFRLVVEEDELHGAIIYGARRTPRYPHILLFNVSKQNENLFEKHKELNPLAQFLVDDLGRIRGSGKMDDEWWLLDKGDDWNATVSEMHHRAIDLIWRRALNWINEGLLA